MAAEEGPRPPHPSQARGGTRDEAAGNGYAAAVVARDVVDTVLGFARTLRHAGVTASPDRVEAMLAAIAHLDVLDPSAVYWAGRLTLCAGPDDLDRYDAAFSAFFGGEVPRMRPAVGPERERRVQSAPVETTGGADEGGEPADLAARTLGAVLKYREDTDRVHALARGALFGGG